MSFRTITNRDVGDSSDHCSTATSPAEPGRRRSVLGNGVVDLHLQRRARVGWATDQESDDLQGLERNLLGTGGRSDRRSRTPLTAGNRHSCHGDARIFRDDLEARDDLPRSGAALFTGWLRSKRRVDGTLSARIASVSSEILSRRADSNCRPAVYECVRCGAQACQDVPKFANPSHDVSRFRRLCPGVVVKMVVSERPPANAKSMARSTVAQRV